MVLQRLLCERVPFAGGNFSFELRVPDLVLVLIQLGPQFTQLNGGEPAQLLSNFLNSAQTASFLMLAYYGTGGAQHCR